MTFIALTALLISPLSYKLLLWTQLQYTAMARHIDAETDPQRKWNALRQFANDISRLRRSSIADDFLQIQRDWLSLSQSNSSEKKTLEFCQWIKRPDIAESIKNKNRGITREQLRKIEEEDLYLLGPDDPSLDEHIAEVNLAKELMARRKTREAEAKRQPGDPAPEPPKINLRDTTFEELFPTIPDKPLTQTHPELDNEVEGQAQLGLPTAPPHQAPSAVEDEAVGPMPSPGAVDSHAEFPLPKGEGQDEGEGTDLPPTTPAPSSAPSVDNPLSQTESNPVQPNPTTPPPDPDVTM